MPLDNATKKGGGLAKYERQILLTIWYIVLFVLSARGIWGYWGDLKEHIVEKELGKKSVIIKVEAKEDKYKEIRERVFKEKGIILTDKDIEDFTNNK